MRTLWAAATLIVGLAFAGCTVKESEDAEGDTTYEVEPANVEVGTDTATVKVPDVDIVPDTSADTTAAR